MPGEAGEFTTLCVGVKYHHGTYCLVHGLQHPVNLLGSGILKSNSRQ